VDVSATALKMGEILFKDYPPVGGCVAPPKFLCFDGRKLPLEASSIDRIICFDALNHVPNRPEIRQEFYRVLRSGGIVGFSEPVGRHSESPQAQMEMRNYGVLEDDIILEELERDIPKLDSNSPCVIHPASFSYIRGNIYQIAGVPKGCATKLGLSLANYESKIQGEPFGCMTYNLE
jgi:SAM-dependent methyltransferase